MQKYGLRTIKTVKTLEEAIIFEGQIIKEYEDIANKNEEERIKNIPRNGDGIAIIKMKCGLECTVDDHIWPIASKYVWNASKAVIRPIGNVDGVRVYLHRYIYETFVGPIPEGMTVDHIKSDQILDVRIVNLRLANNSLQQHNRLLKSRDEKYRCVYFSNGSFHVYVSGIHYGTFETAEEAALKANEINTEKYGDCALC